MRPRRPPFAASGTLLCLPALLLLSAPAAVLGQEGESRVSETALVAKGRVSYTLFCKSCHGEWGKGDGSAAEFLKVPPADLTAISARNDGEFPFDKIYKTIDGREVRAHGSDMPVWGEAFKQTEETDDEVVIKEKVVELVYYLKSIQGKTEPATGKTE